MLPVKIPETDLDASKLESLIVLRINCFNKHESHEILQHRIKTPYLNVIQVETKLTCNAQPLKYANRTTHCELAPFILKPSRHMAEKITGKLKSKEIGNL